MIRKTLVFLLLLISVCNVFADNFSNYWEAGKKAYNLKKYILGYPNKKYAYYNIACCYSLLIDQDDWWKKDELNYCLENLDKAIENGFDDYKHIVSDPDLHNALIRDGEYLTKLLGHFSVTELIPEKITSPKQLNDGAFSNILVGYANADFDGDKDNEIIVLLGYPDMNHQTYKPSYVALYDFCEGIWNLADIQEIKIYKLCDLAVYRFLDSTLYLDFSKTVNDLMVIELDGTKGLEIILPAHITSDCNSVNYIVNITNNKVGIDVIENDIENVYYDPDSGRYYIVTIFFTTLAQYIIFIKYNTSEKIDPEWYQKQIKLLKKKTRNWPDYKQLLDEFILGIPVKESGNYI